MNRLFLAVPVRLYDYEKIRSDFSPLLEGRWRDEKHLHITIAFLGERFNADELIEKLSHFQFTFTVSELTRFDYFANSRVFVTTTYNPTLQHLYDQLASLLGLEHVVLNPHVTLMRVKNIVEPSAFFNCLEGSSQTPIGILEPKIALYQSHLYPTGAQYEILKKWSPFN
ncbi:Phosphoesterase HXTX [Sulfuricurvum kujiense DSM 16994]|uniref:Phosphoesterase HXTX n=1 Tax=Sulfuricurvum kujiense (strain ATCC BAA-921 / DSM 16994 / JCM 11577 / YK-1) TaxID=709032 RepID=E4TWC2_SULKY|nr:2'-5' RNA ligase family protein [Sulfuricurvum kujiense]ADR33740.1 Phosphoesterase HXTX [Sulfuricurvum kujiense DSM 16994]